MLPQPTPSNGLMRQKSMLLLGKLLRTKEPDIEQDVDKKKVSTVFFFLFKYLCNLVYLDEYYYNSTIIIVLTI